jgi:LPPG:FO 2-phospho-L-lactate transferase
MSGSVQPKVLALAGGVGGAKLCVGLSKVLAPDELQIVVNTGDDFWHLGLAISPDLDSVLYALAGLNDTERGWGRAGESWNFMTGLEKLGAPTWFKLGDLDLATHVWRTDRLLQGQTLSEITTDLARRLGIIHRIAPMSDDTVQTIVESDEGRLEFQDYFVARQCRPQVNGFSFDGASEAEPSVGFMDAVRSTSLHTILFCPSNPFVSIDPILSVLGIRQSLESRRAPIVAVSPIVGGQAVKGPAAKMMAELGMPATSLAIARHYGELLDGLVVDSQDVALKREIEATGCKVLVCNTLMRSDADRIALARETLAFAATLAPRC